MVSVATSQKMSVMAWIMTAMESLTIPALASMGPGSRVVRMLVHASQESEPVDRASGGTALGRSIRVTSRSAMGGTMTAMGGPMKP